MEEVSLYGERRALATVRLRGFISSAGKVLYKWADVKTEAEGEAMGSPILEIKSSLGSTDCEVFCVVQSALPECKHFIEKE